MNQKNRLRSRTEDHAGWYTDLILQSGLADYAPVKGCMVLRPYGWALWENLQKYLDPMLKDLGCQNTAFPLLIPESFLRKEAQHVEGFAPELAVVTHAGGAELEEPLVVRPTSETIMYAMYAKWIQSYRDLPLSLNQWANVVRWEKRTYFFLRTTEFFWQEGHTAHATHEEAQQMVLAALSVYDQLAHELLAMPVVKGIKSAKERFAGAVETTTIEAMMPDGKALQSGTSHDLGQNFARAFDIKFQTEAGGTDFVWQTSFGMSTRILGGLILTHSDDFGLVLPPKIAPVQVVILPVRSDNSRLVEKANEWAAQLRAAGLRVEVDARIKHSLGYRINDAELRGIPLRLEIGERELDCAEVTIAVRHLREKKIIVVDRLVEDVQTMLDWIQSDLLKRAQERQAALTTEVATWEDFVEVMKTKRGFIRAYWDERSDTEAKIKELTKATTRCLPLEEEEGEGYCVYSGQPAKRRWLFAQAY